MPARSLLPVSSDFFLDPEDGDDIFLGNIGLPPKYTTLEAS
jgi:hypothetical protein